jgi:hypothetical protein
MANKTMTAVNGKFQVHKPFGAAGRGVASRRPG